MRVMRFLCGCFEWNFGFLSEFGAEFLGEVGDHLVHHGFDLLVLEGLFIVLEGDGDGI